MTEETFAPTDALGEPLEYGADRDRQDELFDDQRDLDPDEIVERLLTQHPGVIEEGRGGRASTVTLYRARCDGCGVSSPNWHRDPVAAQTETIAHALEHATPEERGALDEAAQGIRRAAGEPAA